MLCPLPLAWIGGKLVVYHSADIASVCEHVCWDGRANHFEQNIARVTATEWL